MWATRYAGVPEGERPEWMWVDNPRETERFWKTVFPSLKGVTARASRPPSVCS